jgi:uroporphyrinogen decarboxylase
MYEVLRGTEQMCIDMIAEPDIAKYILGKLQDFHYKHMKKILEQGNGKIDITQITDDFGSQIGLMFSSEMIDEYLREYYDKNIALARSYNSIVFHHDDGAMTEMIPWLLDRGIQVLNPLQCICQSGILKN